MEVGVVWSRRRRRDHTRVNIGKMASSRCRQDPSWLSRAGRSAPRRSSKRSCSSSRRLSGMRCSRSRVYAKTRLTYGLLSADPSVTYELHDFVKEQEERQAEMAEGLVRFLCRCPTSRASACDDVVDAFQSKLASWPIHRMTFMERAAFREVSAAS